MGQFGNVSTKALANAAAEVRGVKRAAKEKVLDALQQLGPLTRQDIADVADIRLASVCSVVHALIREKVLHVKDRVTNPETNMLNERVAICD